MYDDFKANNRKCRLSIAKEHLFPDQLGFALPKKSPLTTVYNYEYVTIKKIMKFDLIWMNFL
jgi:hypothetical protein